MPYEFCQAFSLEDSTNLPDLINKGFLRLITEVYSSSQMIYLTVLLSMVSAANGNTRDTTAVLCDGVIFDGTYFDRENIHSGHGKSFNLVMHDSSGELFFSHTTQNMTTKEYNPKIISCHIQNKTCRNIPGIVKGFAIGHDPTYDYIYFGGFGGSGLYRYNNQTKKADYFMENGIVIWNIYIHDTFYYVAYPSQQLYVYVSGKFEKSELQPNVLNFLANDKAFYFSNRTGLYFVRRRNLAKIFVLMLGIYIRQIVADSSGTVYFCASDGIYTEDKPFFRIKQIARIGETNGFTFIKQPNLPDQLVYSTKSRIYKLIPSAFETACAEALLNKEDMRMVKWNRKPSSVHLNFKLDIR